MKFYKCETSGIALYKNIESIIMTPAGQKYVHQWHFISK